LKGLKLIKVSVFLRYNRQDVTFLNLFISITLCMFRVETPPITTSLDCTHRLWYLLNLAATCCDHGWDGTPAARFDKYQKLCVQSELLMMGEGSTRNMQSVIEINKLRKVTSCWLYLRNISEIALNYECQKS
jgi:hypothetical protein